MGRRIVGWAFVASGTLVAALGAFLAWSTWDSQAWGFDGLSPTAAIAAGLGTVSLGAGVVLLRGALVVALLSVVLGVAMVVLAADLVARDAGGWLLGELDGWQGSDADGASSLAPAWALLAQGVALIGVALWSRRLTRERPQRLRTILPS